MAPPPFVRVRGLRRPLAKLGIGCLSITLGLAGCTTTDQAGPLDPDTPTALVAAEPPESVARALEEGPCRRAYWKPSPDLLLQASVQVRARHVDLVWRRVDGMALTRSLEVPFWPTAVFFDTQGRMCVAGKSVDGRAFLEAFVLDPPTSKGADEGASASVPQNIPIGPQPGGVDAEPEALGGPLEGGDIRSSSTLLVLETRDLIHFAQPDPDRPGALLLQLFASREIYRARNVAGGAPVQLELLARPSPPSDARPPAIPAANSSRALVVPELAAPHTHTSLARHVSAGRVLLFNEGTFTRGLVLGDADGDGAFEVRYAQGGPGWDALELDAPGSFLPE